MRLAIGRNTSPMWSIDFFFFFFFCSHAHYRTYIYTKYFFQLKNEKKSNFRQWQSEGKSCARWLNRLDEKGLRQRTTHPVNIPAWSHGQKPCKHMQHSMQTKKKQNNTIITSHWHTNQELHSMQAEDFAPSTYILLSNFPVSSDQNITNFNSLAVALDYKFK